MAARSRPYAIALAVAVAVVVVQALLVPLFAGLASDLAPRDLPVVVAGPAGAAEELAARLSAAGPGWFEVDQVGDAGAADRALRDREAYAAFVLGPEGPTLHTASAASPVVAQLLSQAAAELGGGDQMPVVDVVPTGAGDPRGAGFSAGFLPLLLTSVAAGALLLIPRGWRARLVGLGGYAVLAGLVGTLVLQTWLGVLPGGYLPVAAVVALLALASSAAVTGLGAVLGAPGAGLGALLGFLLGNPLSGVAAAPELLPQPWGQLGQLLPPGAGGTLLRSVAWFDGAGSIAALWTLVAWAVLGLVLVAVGRASVVLPARARGDDRHRGAAMIHGPGS